ncbi:unnamed protein product, partial [Adineta steineri]
MFWIIFLFSLFSIHDSIRISLIKDNILIGVISKSLLDLTQDQCICEMLNSDESIYALNYFSTNQTCQLLYSNITST